MAKFKVVLDVECDASEQEVAVNFMDLVGELNGVIAEEGDTYPIIELGSVEEVQS